MRLINGDTVIEWLKINNFRKLTAEEIIYEIETGHFDSNQGEARLREALEKISEETDDPISMCRAKEALSHTEDTGIQKVRTLDEWHEDYGDVLWWTFPIQEPPYVGSPLCNDWPEYHTHWTVIAIPGITDK